MPFTMIFQDECPQIECQRPEEAAFFQAVLDGDIALVGVILKTHPKAVLWHQGADEEAGDETTGLMFAAMRRDKPMVAFLLERGAELEAKDRTLGTALTSAVECGAAEVVEFLLQRGACTDVRSSFAIEGTPIAIARKTGRDDIEDMISRAAEIRAQYLALLEKQLKEEHMRKLAEIDQTAREGLQTAIKRVKSIRFR